MLGKPFGRRTLLRGAGALTAAALAPSAAGCASDDDENALTFFFSANPDEANARMRVINEFQRQHPDIKVRPLLSGPGVMQQLSTFCAGGKCPDVLMSWELTYAELAARGVLLDLNTMLARDKAFAAELKADSIGRLYDTFAYDAGSKSGQYAFPEQWAGNYLFYNKRLFAEAGVPPPPTTWEKPWTFAQFLDAANALTRRDGSGRATQWGFVNTWWSYYAAGLFAMNNGVPWSTPLKNPTHMNFGDPAFIEAVQFYADLSNKHKAAPNASETQSMSTPDLFAVGKAAMALGGHWRYQTFMRAEGLDFDVTTLPVGPSLPVGHAAISNIGATGLAISASSQRKEQAWEFVKFAAGPIGQRIIGESCLFVPALRSALTSDGFAKAHHRVRNLAVLTSGPDHADSLPVTPAWEKVVALMDREFGPVLRGSRPATSLAGLAHDVDEVLRAP
jgi:multiple sugar transport system substrate-binding protein